MRRRVASTVKQLLLQPAEYRWHQARLGLHRLVTGGPDGVHVLAVTDGRQSTSDQQYAPLRLYAATLRRRLGVVIRFMHLEEAQRLDRSAMERFQVVGLKLSFQTPAGTALEVARTFRDRLGEGARLVYFDGEDDLCVQWPEVLRTADLYVKGHVFRDRNAYCRPYVGKSNLTDYVARTSGVSFAADVIPSCAPLEREDAARIRLGWNIAFGKPIAKLAAAQSPPPDAKDVDVVCRAAVPADWSAVLRKPVLDALEGAPGRWSVLTPSHVVPQMQYYEEMRRSRICVSPFGYGEICWRDFEAILCGCMVVKPDMGHVETFPDVFLPGETYVPVRWDYSDLIEKCARYLEDEPARRRIADRAREILLASLGRDRFSDVVKGLLDELGFGSKTSTVPP